MKKKANRNNHWQRVTWCTSTPTCVVCNQLIEDYEGHVRGGDPATPSQYKHTSCRQVDITPEVEAALAQGADVAISISGGKDSQALLSAVTAYLRSINYQGRVYAVHSNLGRAEWAGAAEHCQRICDAAGVPLEIVTRPQGDLIDLMTDRLETLEAQGSDAPFWPDSSSRYCTSQMKRDQIDKVLRRSERLVISVEGMRAAESDDRACKPVSQARTRICTKKRTALTWLAIHSWSIDDVWAECGTSAADLERRRALYKEGRRAGDQAQQDEALRGWPCARPYVFGNDRFSCVFCVLGSVNDLTVGADHNPGLLATYIQLQDRSGKTFKHGFDLRRLLPAQH